MNTKLLASLGGAVVMAGTVLATWEDWGWPFNKQYRAEHLDTPTSQVILENLQRIERDNSTQMEALRLQQIEAHEHWLCDEDWEDILELKTEGIPNETDPVEKATKEQDLADLEQLYRDRNCARFTKVR